MRNLDLSDATEFATDWSVPPQQLRINANFKGTWPEEKVP